MGNSFTSTPASSPESGLYISQDDLQAAIPEDEFLQLTDRVNDPPTTPNPTEIAEAIEAAEGRMHTFLARRYQLPLDASDPILLGYIRRILVDFAWEALFPRADMAPKELTARTADHEKALAAIRDGQADLPATTPPPAASAESKILGYVPPRRFCGLP